MQLDTSSKMFEKIKSYIPYAVAILAVVVIGYIGHRPKAVKAPPPVVIEQPVEPAPVEPEVVVEEEPSEPEAPVVVPQKPQPKKPVKKPKKQPKPKRQVVEHTPRVPVPGPRRVCDETGWCWTYLW